MKFELGIACVDPALHKNEIEGITAKETPDGQRFAGLVQFINGTKGEPILLDGDGDTSSIIGEIAVDTEGRKYGYINDTETDTSVYGEIHADQTRIWMRAAGGVASLVENLHPVVVNNHQNGHGLKLIETVAETDEERKAVREASKTSLQKSTSLLLDRLGFQPNEEIELNIVAEGHTDCKMERANHPKKDFDGDWIAEAVTERAHMFAGRQALLELVDEILGNKSQIIKRQMQFRVDQTKTAVEETDGNVRQNNIAKLELSIPV